jgi:hypothetical protein
MSAVISAAGNIMASGNQTLVRGPYKEYNAFCGVKVYRTTNVDASGSAYIQWEGKVWDTGGFVTSFPNYYITIPRNGWYSCIAYINTTVYTYHVGRIDILVNATVFDSERLQMHDNSAALLMNANSVYLADRYYYAGDVITVLWDTNGVSGITLHNGGENGCACTVWRVG